MGSFCVLLKASWEPFGWSWGLLGSSRSLPHYFKNDSGALLGFFLSSSLYSFSLLHPLPAWKWFLFLFWGLFFFSSWSVARSILSSRDDRPTLTHSTHSTHSRQRPQAWESWLPRSQVGKGRRGPRRAYNLQYICAPRGRIFVTF